MHPGSSKPLFESNRGGLALKHLSVVVQLAGALKLWLECLPEPLIRPDLSRILVQAICCLDSEADRMHVMQQVLIHVSVLSSSPRSLSLWLMFPSVPINALMDDTCRRQHGVMWCGANGA